MTETPSSPDVEAIMADIRREIAAAGGLAPGEPPGGSAAEAGLRENLAAANRLHAVGAVTGGGAAALARRATHKLLGTLIAQINEFNARTVRVLNEIVGIMEGEETASTGQVLEQSRRRLELVSELSRRLAEYDALDIDARLRRLEERNGVRDARGKA
ncbi:MAG: hypothetical protein FJ225_01935 [Lentisphaerae bacterium]|nr:hypothetical protein [Lentisphaerota bacterium]